MVAVAQLVRVPDCDSGCRGFESRRSPHSPGCFLLDSRLNTGGAHRRLTVISGRVLPDMPSPEAY